MTEEKKAVKPEENKEPTQQPRTSEELGLLLSQQYQVLMNTQQNIQNINQELQKRIEGVKDGKGTVA
jgi:hypothetical protein